MTLSLHQLRVGHAGIPLWQALDLELCAGQAVAVLGSNGSGKSSLLRAIAGDLACLSGSVSLPRGGVAWLPQHAGLLENAPLRVIDVAQMGLWARLGFYGKPCRHDRALIDAALELVGLSDQARSPVSELSGGQIQRLMFARLSVQDCPLILLDEPFSALDIPTRATLLDVIEQWTTAGKIVMAALHDLDAARRFPLWLELSRGTEPALVARRNNITDKSVSPVRVIQSNSTVSGVRA